MKEELLDEILEDTELLINVRFLEVGHTSEWYMLSKLPLAVSIYAHHKCEWEYTTLNFLFWSFNRESTHEKF